MSKHPFLEQFSQVPLFQGLNETEIRQVAEIAQVKEFSPGEVIIRQGQRGQELWVLLEGKCDVIKLTGRDKPRGEAVLLAVLEANSHFGEMSFFHSAPHSASVLAKTQVKLLRIARGDYEELIQEGCKAAYKLAYNTVQSLAERLRKMDEWVAELLNNSTATGPAPTNENGDSAHHAQEWADFREKMLASWNI
jgi:CRP-like cAMP-binding protein